MKVLVTGGAGFIGQHVVRRLRERGDSVRVALAPGEPAVAVEGLGCELCTMDVRDLPSVLAAVQDCQVVIHMAAIFATWMKDYRPMYQVNVQGTRNVFLACEKLGVEKVVYTSSVAALGVEEGRTPATEDTEFNQHGCANHYVLSKYYSERVAIEFVERGLPVVIVNPSFPFGGADRRPTPTGRTILRILDGGYLVHGPGGLNVVDVEDVARGHILALDKGRVGVRYLLSGTDISHADFFETVKRLGKVERRTIQLPAGLLIFLGGFGDLVGKFREPMFDSDLARYVSRHMYFDCSRAKAELGYEVTPLEEALERSIRWFEANGYLSRDASWRLKLW